MTLAGTKSFTVDTSEIEKMAATFAGSEPMVKHEMVTGFRQAGNLAKDAAIRFITPRTGNLAKSAQVQTTLTAKTIEARVRFTAPYAGWVNDGRGPVVARGKALHFFIDGKEIFVKSVGPSKPVKYAEKGLAAATPAIMAAINATAARIAANLGRAL